MIKLRSLAYLSSPDRSKVIIRVLVSEKGRQERGDLM